MSGELALPSMTGFHTLRARLEDYFGGAWQSVKVTPNGVTLEIIVQEAGIAFAGPIPPGYKPRVIARYVATLLESPEEIIAKLLLLGAEKP